MEIKYKESRVKVNLIRLCVKLTEFSLLFSEKNKQSPITLSIHPQGFPIISVWKKDDSGDLRSFGSLFAEWDFELICELLEIDSQKFINEISEDASNGSK